MHDHPVVVLKAVAARSRALLFMIGATLGVFFSSGDAAAQQRHISVGAGWYNPGGDDFRETESGPGLDIGVRFAVGERVYLAFGSQWNFHGVDFSDDDWNVLAVFVEPSVVLLPGAGVEPFIAGRVAWLRQSITAPSGRRIGNGVGFGGFLGLRIPLADQLGVEVAAPLYAVSFGDVDVDGVKRPDSDSSGHALGFRVALNISF